MMLFDGVLHKLLAAMSIFFPEGELVLPFCIYHLPTKDSFFCSHSIAIEQLFHCIIAAEMHIFVCGHFRVVTACLIICLQSL